MIAKGYGKRQLIVKDAQTEEEHQINRRTEFKVIEIKE
jgi:outer membrane protein OmpA-like peptidoglycan-associated protein